MNKEVNDIVPGVAHPSGTRAVAMAAAQQRVFGEAESAHDDGGVLSPHEILRVFGKWRWLIAGTTAAALVFAAIVTMLTPKMYRAMAQVELSLQTVSVSTDKGGDSSDVAMRDPQFIGTQLGLLRSRDLAERVARGIDAASRAKLAPGVVDPSAQIQSATAAVGGGYVSNR